jgi:hypothetical protein
MGAQNGPSFNDSHTNGTSSFVSASRIFLERAKLTWITVQRKRAALPQYSCINYGTTPEKADIAREPDAMAILSLLRYSVTYNRYEIQYGA